MAILSKLIDLIRPTAETVTLPTPLPPEQEVIPAELWTLTLQAGVSIRFRLYSDRVERTLWFDGTLGKSKKFNVRRVELDPLPPGERRSIEQFSRREAHELYPSIVPAPKEVTIREHTPAQAHPALGVVTPKSPSLLSFPGAPVSFSYSINGVQKKVNTPSRNSAVVPPTRTFPDPEPQPEATPIQEESHQATTSQVPQKRPTSRPPRGGNHVKYRGVLISAQEEQVDDGNGKTYNTFIVRFEDEALDGGQNCVKGKGLIECIKASKAVPGDRIEITNLGQTEIPWRTKGNEPKVPRWKNVYEIQKLN